MEKGKDQEIAQSLKDFWEWIQDKDVGVCSGGYDEWCGDLLFNKTDAIMSCVLKRNRSILDCIDTERRKVKRDYKI